MPIGLQLMLWSYYAVGVQREAGKNMGEREKKRR